MPSSATTTPQAARPGTGSVPPSEDPVYSQSRSSTATNRLSQISSHVSTHQSVPFTPNTTTKKSRSKKSKLADDPNALPDDYADILAHLSTMRRIARTPDLSSRGYQRQKTSGKLWSRERIERLLVPGSWEELGSVTGTVDWERDGKNPRTEHVKGFIP
jgi:hypothetical protein